MADRDGKREREFIGACIPKKGSHRKI